MKTATLHYIIKIAIIILLLLCLLPMPYGFYQFVRFFSAVGFAWLAYDEGRNGYKTEMWIYIILAILFQPLLKVSLGRTIWNILDVVIAIGLVISIFIKHRRPLQ